MKMIGVYALLVSVAVIGTAIAAPVSAAPSGAESAQDTVTELESEGYTVILTKVGNAPLIECSVISVQPGQVIVQRRTDSSRSGNRSVNTVVRKTVYVRVQC